LNGKGVVVRVPVGVRFSPLSVFRNDSRPHPASYLMGTRSVLPGGKAVET
jgi:hypothetical protein